MILPFNLRRLSLALFFTVCATIVTSLLFIEKLGRIKQTKKDVIVPSRLNHWNDSEWKQTYNSDSGKVFVFSAYYDDRENLTSLRVISAVSKLNALFCVMFKNQTTRVSQATEKSFNFYKTEFRSSLITCPLELSWEIPEYVRIVGNKTDTAFTQTNSVKIKVLSTQRASPAIKIASCYQPLHGKKTDFYQMYFHVEMMRKVGVNKFIFYYDPETLTDALNVLLDYYISHDVVIPVRWKLFSNPRNYRDLISVYGQYNQVADCFYRFMYDFEYIFNIDIDEIALPTREQSWQRVLPKLWGQNESINGFLISNAYVLPEDIPRTDEDSSLLSFAGDGARVTVPCEGPFIDKYIAKPRKIIWAYVHQVITAVKGTQTLRMNADVGLKYHFKYRSKNILKKCLHSDGDPLPWREGVERIGKKFSKFCNRVFRNESVCRKAFS